MRLTYSPRVHQSLFAQRLRALFAVAALGFALTTDQYEVLAQNSPGSTRNILSNSDTSTSELGSKPHRTPAITDVRVSSFQDVTPGESTLAGVKKLLGAPLEELDDESAVVYKVGPFPRIEFLLKSKVVNSIVIHLAGPSTAEEIAAELGLSQFRPVAVKSESGERLGQVYPERGVVFGFTSENGESKVSHLVLEPIAAEPFVLRAEGTKYDYLRALADLDYASKLEPKDAAIHWQKARILTAGQRHAAALEAVDAAVRLDGSNPHYRLTRSKVLLHMDQHDLAVMDVQEVLDRPDIKQSVKAQAECQLGDLLAAAPEPDFGHAIQHHQAAIDLAAKAAANPEAEERDGAMRTLIDAHLAIANDITWGDWSKKAEVAPKWLRNANELVNDVIKNGGHESIRLKLMCQALAAYSGMQGAVDPTSLIAKTLKQGQQLIAQSDDPLRQAELRWQLFNALFNAARIEQLRGDTEQVIEYGRKADELLEAMADNQPTAPRSRYLIGRFHFLIGSTYAIRKKDHEEAVRWYEKSRMYISRKVPATYTAEAGLHGQRFVSMGVSYWQVDAKDDAIRLTETGMQLMEEASNKRDFDKHALGVPYSNLAAMYRSLGRDDDASKLAAKAKAVQPGIQRR